ncbi:MAG: FKBP-type peptidyl-prolyl cis-trans isomerase [Bacteroidales bacterium]|nr:FKBP-type peptidyl-prolyl cis-trans isomerase [Bacteroidales bacterium]
MKIAASSVVELIYELVVEGNLVDHTTAEKPLDFIFGTGSLLPKFEEHIAGLEPGAKFAFTLTPEEGYGVSSPENLIELPVAAFDGHREFLQRGAQVPLTDGNGGMVIGRITEIGELFVKLDLNHPMADKTLEFSGEIISVREATEKELTEGLHGELVRRGCGGCHGGGCHGGCGGGCGKGEGGCNCGGEGGDGCNCDEGGCGCGE